jgi:hypothetical protein
MRLAPYVDNIVTFEDTNAFRVHIGKMLSPQQRTVVRTIAFEKQSFVAAFEVDSNLEVIHYRLLDSLPNLERVCITTLGTQRNPASHYQILREY